MSPDRFLSLRQRAEALEAAGLARRLVELRPDSAVTARLRDGRQVLVFSSLNDYLGLAYHPDVVAAWRGAGAGSSRLIAGSRPAHRVLEEALEERWGRPALVFSSGYQANLAVMSTLFVEGDGVGSDALNHASIIDGLRLSRAERVVLPHGEVGPASLRGVVVEGLFSMDGDIPDLRAYSGGERWLVVDEAHAVGALGPGGRGAAAAQGVVPDVLTGTFGKAYGAAGAFVIGPPELRQLLISSGRSFIYTTALAEPAALAAAAGLAAADDALRERLTWLTRRFRQGLADLGLPTCGDAHIVPVLTGPRTMAAAAALLEQGIFVPGIRAPTVPPGEERLRFSLSAAHTPEQIDRTLEALQRCVR